MQLQVKSSFLAEVEVLGRCITCYRQKLSSHQCRVTRGHEDKKASICQLCYEVNPLSSVTMCRQTLKHQGHNALQAVEMKVPCNELPACASELLGLTVERHVHDERDDEEENENYHVPYKYAVGYMTPYSNKAWEAWLQKFSLQTHTSFKVRNGRQTNAQSREKGAIRFQDETRSYTTEWVQPYRCMRGGKPRHKALSLTQRHRTCPGSKLLGCTAHIQTRLLKVENGGDVLEIKLPLMSAHLPVHNPQEGFEQLAFKPLKEIEDKVTELVQQCYLRRKSLKAALTAWVEKELIPQHLAAGVLTSQPSVYNRTYYPTNEDLRTLTRKALVHERGSAWDQPAVQALLEEEEKRSGTRFYFQQYKKPGRYNVNAH